MKITLKTPIDYHKKKSTRLGALYDGDNMNNSFHESILYSKREWLCTQSFSTGYIFCGCYKDKRNQARFIIRIADCQRSFILEGSKRAIKTFITDIESMVAVFSRRKKKATIGRRSSSTGYEVTLVDYPGYIKICEKHSKTLKKLVKTIKPKEIVHIHREENDEFGILWDSKLKTLESVLEDFKSFIKHYA